jgi:hypothetical protein
VLLGVSGALCALALPVGAADISQAREVAPPPGDRGELLYEVPIAPATPSGVKAQPRREVRDTTQAPAPGAPTSRQAVKPETPGSAPARRMEKGPGSASASAARTDQAPGTGLRAKEGQARLTVRGGREVDVSRETPPGAGQRAKAKQVAAAPASRAMKSEKVDKVEKARGDAKAPAKRLAGAAPPPRQPSQPQRSSASVKAGARQGHVRASKAIVAKQAPSSKRATSPERAAAKAVRHTPVTSTARATLKAAPKGHSKGHPKAAPKVSAKTGAKRPAKAPAKGAPKTARHAAKAATQGSSRRALPTTSPAVKSKKPAPQKSPRALSR